MDNNFPRINQLPPYVFDEIQKLKTAARKKGEDIIDFGMGNPDQSTPDEIVEKLENLSCKVALTGTRNLREFLGSENQSLIGIKEILM